MNLQKMFEMQKALDERVLKDKGLEGQDLLAKTYVALDTELAEFANEGRWFKYWSSDQEPRACVIEKKGEFAKEYYKNPLLEEYVDCVHLFLSIAIKKGWEDAMNIQEEGFEELKKKGFEGGLTGIFLEMKWWLLNSYMSSTKKTSFSVAWSLFLSVGTIGFGFSWDQIEDAYMKKNAINHQRQQEGY
ncbi:dUTP diphosphatase [Bacillus atrophaeus]|uniref:dUTP diphosphatase n=1 Tax=Bacillus atrophaeus TaxID=1452 RepID=UPI002DBBCE0E|nr:dUTP diphosphatase [Bacillus atrophaeus]MEC2307672.1 dUTP diphosphatase [Bacillus atrophaeus]